MKKLTLLFAFIFTVMFTYGDNDFTIGGIGWVWWPGEPAGVENANDGGYDANPYTRYEVDVLQAYEDWSPVASVEDFDATWALLGPEHFVSKPTNVGGGDFYDLAADGSGTFGASWKAVHDGANLYILLKYRTTGGETDAGSHEFEIMTQPTQIYRHEPTFIAASDSTETPDAWEGDWELSPEELVIAYQNQAYARSIHFGGGKAMFKDGAVGAFEASHSKAIQGWTPFWGGNWGNNEAGLIALATADHFWNNTDGLIKAVIVMSFDGALSYPTDPANIGGDRTALEIGGQIAFDVMTGAINSESDNYDGDEQLTGVKYCWASWNNNVYASNYYTGILNITDEVLSGTNISDVLFEKEPSVYAHNGIVYVKGAETADLEVYSILGAKVLSAQNVRSLALDGLQKGIYLVRINNQPKAVKIINF